MSQKVKYLIVPITLGIVAIVTIVLAICKQAWYYYLVGALVSLLNHGLMVKQTARIERYAKLDPEGTTLNPKKTALLWYFLRVIVFVGVFASLAIKANPAENKPEGIIELLIAFGGYLTLKVVFILCLLICRKKVEA